MADQNLTISTLNEALTHQTTKQEQNIQEEQQQMPANNNLPQVSTNENEGVTNVSIPTTNSTE